MNKSNFLNSLRDETIQEYLHSDRNRSSLLAHQIRKSVSNFEGVTEPGRYEAIDELELRNANANVNEIKQKLLDTFNRLNTLYNDNTYNTTKYSELYNSVGNYTTVLIDYNKLVTLYLTTTNNVLTRQNIFTALMETKDIYRKLANITLNILNNYNKITDPRMRQTAIRKYFVKVLLLYSLFDIIYSQFDTNQFFVIPEDNILRNIKFAPDWVQDVLEEFRLRPELYGISPNIPFMGGLPPGGGGGGGGGGGTGGFPPGGGFPPFPPRGPRRDDSPRTAPSEGDVGDENDGGGGGGAGISDAGNVNYLPSASTTYGDSRRRQPTSSGYFEAPPAPLELIRGETLRSLVLPKPEDEISLGSRGSRGSPQFLTPTGASRPTTETFSGIAPQRQQLQSEEGDIQAQEQGLDTRRVIAPQGSLQGSPRGSPEHYQLSPEKAGLENIGSEQAPVWVKRNRIPKEKIIEFCNIHTTNDVGKDYLIDVLGKVNKELEYIVSRVRLPKELSDRVSSSFPDYDETRIACFIFISSLFKKLDREKDKVKSIDMLVVDVADYIFVVNSVDWVKHLFNTMKSDAMVAHLFKEVYYYAMAAELNADVLDIFTNLEDVPPLEELGEATGATHSEGAQPKPDDDVVEEGKEEDEEEDEEVEPSGEEADENETFENFKEEQKKLSDTLKRYREDLEKVLDTYLLKPAKASYEAGKDLTVTLAGETIKVSREVLKYLVESPAIWLGFLLFAVVGDYIPLYGSQTVFDYAAGYGTRTIAKGLADAAPVKFLFGMLGRKIKYADPEVDTWATAIHRVKGGLVGAQYGAMAQVTLDLLNKLLYRIELTARYKYPIPQGNALLDMLALSNNAAKIIAKGQNSIMLKSGGGYKKEAKALMDRLQKLEKLALTQQLQLTQGSSQSSTFPFPTSQALELPKAKAKPPVVSTDEQYKEDLTSGSEAGSESGMVNTKPSKKAKSKAKSSGGSFIKGQTLKPIDERYVIGSGAMMPYNDLENDSFLIKSKPTEPVV